MSEIRNTVCALDCPDTCSVLVHIDDEGRAFKLTGDKDHPITRGFLCGKVTRYLDREYHPSRLLYPQRRVGPKGSGQFVRISWDEALDEIAGRLQRISDEAGPEAILPYSYAGTMGYLNGAGMDRRFFHRLGASRLDRTICATAGGAALVASQGLKLGTEPEQFLQSKLIIAWGANILGTNVHLWPFIVEARRRGAKLYVIDPIKNRTGRAADKHIAPYPGSDLALALGIIHVLCRDQRLDRDYISSYTHGFEDLVSLASEYAPSRVAELTGVAAADVEELALTYATARPAVIRLNYGLQRSDRGGSAVRAIAALPVITGSWREVGGGLQLSTSGAFQLNTAALEKPELQLRSPLGRPARLVNMAHLGQALNEMSQPAVQSLVVYNSNPAVIAPHQNQVLAGLRRPDLFTVVLEHFQTDTADYADILLPATTFLEHTDLYFAYGHYYLQLARPALPAPGEARSNIAIFRALAKRMAFTEPCFDESEDEMIQNLLSSNSPFLQGITLERLERQRSVRLNISPLGVPFQPFALGNFGTPSGRFEFGADTLSYTAPVESRQGDQKLRTRFPLELISSKNDDSMNSTFGFRESVDSQTAVLYIHPEDALPRSIVDGMAIRAFNERGSCTLTARLTTDVLPGVIRVPSTRWNKRAVNGSGINSLTSTQLTDLGGGATFYSCLVQVAAETSAIRSTPEEVRV